MVKVKQSIERERERGERERELHQYNVLLIK
jgi:hypothetical protein